MNNHTMNKALADERFVRQARRALSASDATMAHIIEQVGAFRPNTVDGVFEALVLSIVHQQVSMKAAQAICKRVRALCPRRRITVAAMTQCSQDDLRGAGLSRPKASYVHNVCAHFADRRVNPRRLAYMSDDAVIACLSDIKGVGVWTAEMILIFTLQRPDVWPVDDLGLRQALQRTFRVPNAATRERLIRAGERFRPYRSIATWYLWSSLNTGVIPGFQ